MGQESSLLTAVALFTAKAWVGYLARELPDALGVAKKIKIKIKQKPTHQGTPYW